MSQFTQSDFDTMIGDGPLPAEETPGTFAEYQRQVDRTVSPKANADFDLALTNWALGAAGEAGEFAGKVKKVVFHGHDLDRDALLEEIGDVLWYLAAAATTLGVPLDGIAQANIRKLRLRYPNGFTSEDSIVRADTRD